MKGFHLSQLHAGWPPQSLGRHQGDFLSYLCSSFQPHFLPHVGIVPCPILLGTGPSHCFLKFYAFNYSVSSHMHSLCLESPSSFSLPGHFSLQFSPSVSLPWHLFLQHQNVLLLEVCWNLCYSVCHILLESPFCMAAYRYSESSVTAKTVLFIFWFLFPSIGPGAKQELEKFVYHMIL